jgi:hypothetical protein
MKYCLKTGKQRHPNELSARMHGGSPVIVLGMDAKVYMCRGAAAFTDRSFVPRTFAVPVFEKLKN